MLKEYIAENLYQWRICLNAPPTQISISPTNSCNLKCQSCWQRDETYQSLRADQRPIEMTDECLLNLVAEAKELGVKCIEITGAGEPLTRRDITVELIKAVKQAGMIGWMTTNGTLFSKEIVKLMVELDWDKITISLDGPDAETNDFLRPPQGTFLKILNTLSLFSEYKKKLAKANPSITFNVVVSKYNVHKLPEMVELASKFGVEGVTFEPIKILAKQCSELSFDLEKDFQAIKSQLEKTRKLSLEKNVFTNIEEMLRSPELVKDSGRLISSRAVSEASSTHDLLDALCLEPWFHIYVEVEGTVRPCCVSHGLGENITKKSLRDIWFGKEFSKFRESILNKNYPLFCNQCNANLICFSRELQNILRERFLKERIYPALKDNVCDTSLKPKIMDRRLKVLVADTAPLYPPQWGGPRRIWHLFSNFSQESFDFTYVGMAFQGSPESRYMHKRIRDNFKEILCVFPPHYYLWNLIERAVLRNTNLDLFLYLAMNTDWQFKYLLNSQEADIIVCSHPWSSPCMQKKDGQFFIYDAHNCEYFLMSKILGRHILKSLILNQVKRIEGDACRKSDLILACSDKEKEDLVKLYKINSDKVIITTNGSDVKEATSLVKKESSRKALSLSNDDKVVVFVGAYYKPNIDAARFIIRKIAPNIPSLKFLLIGTISKAFISEQMPSNIKFLSRVTEEQLETALRAADIAINPMFSGSGINIKMLDYMAYGLPIVTTACGARGIETYGKQPMIVSSADNFVENLKILSSNSQLCERLSEDGRNLIVKYYDWKIISHKLQEIILERMSKF